MKITAITISAGRTFNHPTEQYANLRSDLTQTATIEEGEDPEACIKALRADTEAKAEKHKADMLQEIHDLNDLAEMERQLNYIRKTSQAHEDLKPQMTELQEKIAALRSKPFLLALPQN